MSEEDIGSNIDWGQSKGFSKNTRISRRLDQKKAMAAESLKKNNFKKTAKPIKKVLPNLKKIQSKIRDLYDDEDEDDDEKSTLVFDFSMDFNDESSLYGVLSEEEKIRFNANKDVENHKMQQTAGKFADILRADQMSKELGLKDIDKKIIRDTTKDVTYDNQTFEKTLLKNVEKKTKIKTDNLSSKETSDAVRGLVKVKTSGILSKENDLKSISDNMSVQNIIEIGKEKNDKKAAKMILEKSGRTDAKDKQAEKQKEKREKINKIEKSLKKIKSR